MEIQKVSNSEQAKVGPRPLAACKKVVIVDDEAALLSSLQRILQEDQYEVITQDDPHRSISLLDDPDIGVFLVDIRMPRMNGLELLKEVKRQRPDIEVIVMTALGSIESAVEAMKAGAYDFLTKPFNNADIVSLTVSKALEKHKLIHRTRYLERQVELSSRFENILGNSAKMRQVFELIQNIAPTNTTALIVGESGTGKELVARAIHERSERRSQTFLAVNCSAFTETILESELFGHTKGSFTGAANYRKGLFEEADGGTVFLDEIGETAPSIQAKLLRVLQEGEVKPVGSNENRKVDVRVIAATNLDLPFAIQEKRFREDLYYRVNVINIQIPPLREREEDIPLLVHHFVRKYASRAKKNVNGVSSKALAVLLTHRWPGNVRELENVVERAVVLAKGKTIQSEDLPDVLVSMSDPNLLLQKANNCDLPYREAKRKTIASFERQYLEDLLTRAGGVIAEAARIAEMDRSNFRRLLNRYTIDVSQFKHS